jgi:hypothetical protein
MFKPFNDRRTLNNMNNSGDSCKLLDAYVIRSKGYI